MKMRLVGWVLVAIACTSLANGSTITLGTFNFNSNQFGNTLNESDGGTFRSSNWLNVVDADPGNPGALTGPNFNTGIANIGFNTTTAIDYTIGYNTPIVNGPGNDMGLVTATATLATSTMLPCQRTASTSPRLWISPARRAQTRW